MTVFNFITLLGGLSFFLYGMTIMSGGLEKMSGSKLESTLKKMTSNRLKSLALGAGITIAIQSSSAMTVMLVGLVNSGIMQLEQTVVVIMGSNVGTTMTAWLTSAAGIESDNVFISLLKPENFSPIFALVGIMLIMLSKNTKRRDIGNVLVGFAVLMFGMKLMSSSMSPLAESEAFAGMLTAFNNPFFGVLIGAAVTGIIQSSAASVGILQALALTGGISYGMALPIIMGQNIGTCVTSLISSIGVNKNAKRVAAVHVSFNVIGTAVFLIAYIAFDALNLLPFAHLPVNTVGIALMHTIFNVGTTIILLPFSKMLVKIASLIVRDSKSEQTEEYTFIDERLLNTPSFAIAECLSRTKAMAVMAESSIYSALTLVHKYDRKLSEQVGSNEQKIDMYEDKLGTYLVSLSKNELSDSDNREISKLLHSIGDFERMGDHAVNLLKTAREIDEKQIRFSADAERELSVLEDALREIIKMTMGAFCNNDLTAAHNVEPLEQVIDELIASVKSHHVNRLQKGNCTIELGFVLNDILTNYERISDHCSNIAVTLIEIEQNVYDTHEYLSDVKTGKDEFFKKAFAEYKAKYAV